MEFTLGTLLLIGKWIFIVLVYAVLFIVLRAVRSEMRQRIGAEADISDVVPGHLRVLSVGTDPRLTTGQLIPLSNTLLVGADSSQLGKDDLLLRDDFVSGRHARLTWDGAQWWVEDMGSTNGTYVDSRRIAPHQRTVLPSDSELKIGDVSFTLLE